MQGAKIKIDSMKLKTAILSKGIKVSDAGKMCGFSSSGIQNAIDRSTITQSMTILIDKILEIPLDEYKYVEPVLEPVKEKSQEVTIDPNQIAYKMMYAAAYAAINTFMSQFMQENNITFNKGGNHDGT